MTKVRILYLAPFPTSGRFAGGISTVASGVRRHLATAEAQGCELEFLNTEPGARDPGGAGKLRLENVAHALRVMRSVAASLRNGGFDVLTISTSNRFALLKDLVLARYVDRGFRGHIFLHVHYADAKNILVGKWLPDALILRLMRQHIDDVIFLSSRTRDEFVALGLPRERAHVLYNFHEIVSDTTLAPRKAHEVVRKEVLDLLFLASIDRRKGVVELLQALLSLPPGRFRLHLCGTPNEPHIEAEIAPYLASLGDRVINHGYVAGPQKLELLKNADIFVLPSHAEGLPMSLLEAMAASCAVVATSVGAIPEVVSNLQEGILVPPGDPSALARALERLLEDRGLCGRLMIASATRARHFTAERFVSELCELYASRAAARAE